MRRMVAIGLLAGTLTLPTQAGAEEAGAYPADLEGLLTEEALFPEGAETLERIVQFEDYPFGEEVYLESGGSWRDYVLRRTHWAFGYDFRYTDNFLLSEVDPAHEMTGTPEFLVFFADPKGDLLYGARYENNSTYYHRLSQWAFTHDFLAFFDVTHLGRYQYGATYRLDITESPTISGEDFDTVRRSSDLIRTVKHTLAGEYKYELNDTNALIPQLEYSLFDDQSNDDGDQDRASFFAKLDLDHDLDSIWTLFGGYEYEDVAVKGNNDKSFFEHSARLGFKYEVSEISDAKLTLSLGDKTFGNDQTADSIAVAFNWAQRLSDRTAFTLTYQDKEISSFAADRQIARIYGPNFAFDYDLTPFTKLDLSGSYQQNRSNSSASGGGDKTRREDYRLGLGLTWQVNDKTIVKLGYALLQAYGNSKGDDFRENEFTWGFEREL